MSIAILDVIKAALGTYTDGNGGYWLEERNIALNTSFIQAG